MLNVLYSGICAVRVHCAKGNLNFCLKTEPVTTGANATENVWFCLRIWPRNQIYIVTSAPAMTGSVFRRRSQIIYGIEPVHQRIFMDIEFTAEPVVFY